MTAPTTIPLHSKIVLPFRPHILSYGYNNSHMAINIAGVNMVINNILQHIFSTPSNVAILRALNQRVVGVSGREVARISNLSTRAAQISLAQLEALGLIKRTIGGRDHLFIINRNNKIVSDLISYIFEYEQNLKHEIISLIKKKLSPALTSLIIFGSVARKEDDLNSDFDLCIVCNKNKSSAEVIVSSLRDKLSDDFNISLAPYYISEAEFKKRAKSNLSPVTDILKEGEVISGKSLKDLIK